MIIKKKIIVEFEIKSTFANFNHWFDEMVKKDINFSLKSSDSKKKYVGSLVNNTFTIKNNFYQRGQRSKKKFITYPELHGCIIKEQNKLRISGTIKINKEFYNTILFTSISSFPLSAIYYKYSISFFAWPFLIPIIFILMNNYELKNFSQTFLNNLSDEIENHGKI